jgi:fatty-acyl-CoA synthase
VGHLGVVEAAVIDIPDSRWDERPLACVVAGANVEPGELKAFLTERVAKWQVPENWAFVQAIPKTSVGKFDKKGLRTQYESGDLAPTRI